MVTMTPVETGLISWFCAGQQLRMEVEYVNIERKWKGLWPWWVLREQEETEKWTWCRSGSTPQG
jgi:hypothetical protein